MPCHSFFPASFFSKGFIVIPGKADRTLNANEAVCEHTDRRTICLHRLRVVQNVSESGSTGAPLSCVSQSFVRNPVACLLFIVARAVRGQLGDSHLLYAALLPKTKKTIQDLHRRFVHCLSLCLRSSCVNDDDMISRSRSSRDMLLLSLQLPN